MSDLDMKIWVMSDLAPDGVNYVATLHVTDDVSHAFPTPQIAVDYTRALLGAWGAAEYDAAVYAQITKKLGMEQDQAVRLLAQFRERRRSALTIRVGPILVTPGVSVFTGKPFIRCEVGDLKWQWDAADVHQHVQHVLEMVSVIELDTLYRAFLIDMGIDEGRALAAVEGLQEFRDAG